MIKISPVEFIDMGLYLYIKEENICTNMRNHKYGVMYRQQNKVYADMLEIKRKGRAIIYC